MPVTLNARASVPSGVIVSDLGDESVILNLETERYFGLDSIGTKMWIAMTSSSSLRAACDSLLREYEVAQETLENDLVTLAEKLLEQGLVEVVADGAPA